jgi:hypothetical protein
MTIYLKSFSQAGRSGARTLSINTVSATEAGSWLFHLSYWSDLKDVRLCCEAKRFTSPWVPGDLG